MGDLSRLTHQNMATLTGVVDRLIKLDLVERRRNEADRRVVHVMLTAAGQVRMIEARRARQADVTQMVAAFSDDEISEFDQLLRKFMAGMAAMTHTALDESQEAESAQESVRLSPSS
jgi:DNA-binding MarR family transcriptional regulator